MAQRTPTEALAAMWNCGILDVDYVLQLEDDFDVDVDFTQIAEEYGRLDANSIIRAIFEQAVSFAGGDTSDPRIEIYTNCLDSHLSVDGEEVYSASDLAEVLQSGDSDDD